MREVKPVVGEYYHVYNRGVDKRTILLEQRDLDRFFNGILQFNTLKVLGSIDRGSRGHSVSTEEKLVGIVGYCINENHFHLILTPLKDGGLEKFMHKLTMGYSKYFNTKYKRHGSLFQGKYQMKHIDSNEYLLHLSAYVNLNHLAHLRGHSVSTKNLYKSSWEEYSGVEKGGVCDTKIILEQFNTPQKYKQFAEDSLKEIVKQKKLIEELELNGIELINTI